MAENTGITWTDSTFNPWIGCQKVGPGCDHCYAEHLMDTRLHRVNWGPGQPRKRTAPKTWRTPMEWNKRPFFECAECSKPDCNWRGEGDGESCSACGGYVIPARRRVFCASLADVFDNEVDPAWRAELFALIAGTPNLDYLLLTKRIGNVAKMIDAPGMQKCGLPPNVWLGITVVNQAEADRDIPKLLATPARVRFLSIEPMLEAIDLTRIDINGHSEICPLNGTTGCEDEDGEPTPDIPAIDWVIVGGESGAQARPFHVDWARSIVAQCKAAGVPVHVKQLGAQPRGWCAGFVHSELEDLGYVNCDHYEAHEQGVPCPGRCAAMLDKAGADWDEWPEDLRVREWPALEGPRS